MATLNEIIIKAGLTMKDDQDVINILENSPYKDAIHKSRFTGITVDGFSTEILAKYVKDCYHHGSQEAAQEAEAEKERKQKEDIELFSNVMITSGPSFEGYQIIDYIDYISEDNAISIPREYTILAHNATGTASKLTYNIAEVRQYALNKLKKKAVDIGCNAVICVDVDYITLEPQSRNMLSGNTDFQPYVLCVCASGTAVRIEKQ